MDDALELAEQIVMVVRWSDFDLFEDRPVTASVGVALHQAHSSAEQLLIKADIAMYVARREGGDRMQIFEEWMRDTDTPDRRLTPAGLRARGRRPGGAWGGRPTADRPASTARGIDR